MSHNSDVIPEPFHSRFAEYISTHDSCNCGNPEHAPTATACSRAPHSWLPALFDVSADLLNSQPACVNQKCCTARTLTLTIPLHSEKVAYECLKLAAWGVDAGIDHFYTSGQQCASSTNVDPRAIEALYQSYKGG